jgi:hypothetical protein
MEGDILKNAVLDKIEEYLAAEQAQFRSSQFDEETFRASAEVAHASLAEARRRYWEHVKLHKCDTATVLTMPPTDVNAIAV